MRPLSRCHNAPIVWLTIEGAIKPECEACWVLEGKRRAIELLETRGRFELALEIRI